MSQERTSPGGHTTDLQSDHRGLWFVWCDTCERLLGDPVPYAMAKSKRRSHEDQHDRADREAVA